MGKEVGVWTQVAGLQGLSSEIGLAQCLDWVFLDQVSFPGPVSNGGRMGLGHSRAVGEGGDIAVSWNVSSSAAGIVYLVPWCIQCLEQFLAHSSCSANVCWMNEWTSYLGLVPGRWRGRVGCSLIWDTYDHLILPGKKKKKDTFYWCSVMGRKQPQPWFSLLRREPPPHWFIQDHHPEVPLRAVPLDVSSHPRHGPWLYMWTLWCLVQCIFTQHLQWLNELRDLHVVLPQDIWPRNPLFQRHLMGLVVWTIHFEK